MMINIGLTLCDAGDSSYVKAAAALYVSMRLATRHRLRFFVIHDETIAKPLRDKLGQTLAAGDQIVFIDINGFPRIKEMCLSLAQPQHTRAVYWRIFVADILSIDQILLCDADLIVLFDITKIWEHSLRGNILSGVLRNRPHLLAYHDLIETSPGSYFRCGFLKIDLRAMRRDAHFKNERGDFIQRVLPEANKIVPLHEQTVFNHFFGSKCLPMKVNLVPLRNQKREKLEELTDSLSLDVPTVLDLKGWWDRIPHDSFYWSFLLLTPWRREAFSHLAMRTVKG